MRLLIPCLVISWCFALAAPGQLPAGLDLIDVSLGTDTAGATTGELIPSHSVALRLRGVPGQSILLAVSPLPAAPGTPPFAGVAIGLDAATAQVILNGFADPALPPIGPIGFTDFAFSVPGSVPFDSTLYLQAVVGDASGALLTNGLALTFSGEPFQTIASGFDTQHPAGTVFGDSTFILENPSQLTAFWSLHAPGTTEPVIDFTASFVFALLWGQGGVAPPNLSFTRLWLDGSSTLRVNYVALFPGTPFPDPPYQPYVIAEVPRAALPTMGVFLNPTFVFAP